MQSISGDEPLDANFFVILYAPNHLGAHKMMQRRFVFPNGFPVDLDNGTLHAVVSYHDPTTCKVSSAKFVILTEQSGSGRHGGCHVKPNEST
jgi:hypothetical protein